MPTVILLDASLSMFRPIVPSLAQRTPSTSGSGTIPASSDAVEERTFMSLAAIGINAFLDYLSANCKMEFVSLVLFSSLYEQVVAFTKDYSEIRTALTRVEPHNKTCFDSALQGVGSLVIEEWGLSASTQILLITDGSPGVGEGSLPHTVQNLINRSQTVGAGTERRGGATNDDSAFLFPFCFSSKLHIMCLTASTDPVYQSTLPFYRQLVSLSSADTPSSCSSSVGGGGCKGGGGVDDRLGGVMSVDGVPSSKSVRRMFTRLAKKEYQVYHCGLSCGNLQCAVTVFPPIEPYEGLEEFEYVKKTPGDSIEILGFIDVKDISSPPHISRHIILPLPPTSSNNTTDNSATKSSQEAASKSETSADLDREVAEKTPTLTVVLHGGLKSPGLVALATIASDWYGMIYSMFDGRKKANLYFSLFKPGTDVLPWLGKLDRLAPLAEVQPSLASSLDVSVEPQPSEASLPFPVHQQPKKSYNQSSVVWIKSAGLQADIQKVLRNAKRLPDKPGNFYKELNRLRRAALSLGFYELLTTMSLLLERECTQLPISSNPDSVLHIQHAAQVLRSSITADADFTIQPRRTNVSIN